MRQWLSTGLDHVRSSGPDRLAELGIYALAISPRILYLLIARPVFESQYWALSDSLLANGRLGFDGVKTTAFEPAYPLFLALARTLVGNRTLLVQVVQSAVAALGAVFLYRLAATLSGRRRVGVIAGMLYAVYPLLIRHSADRTDAALMTTFLLAFASQFTAATTPARAAAAGGWLGLAVLTRMMALPLIPLAAAIQRRNHGWRGAAAVTLPALVVIAPYAIRNYALNGAIVPTRSGLNLFISNSEYTAKIFPDYGPDILEEYAASVVESRGVSPGPSSPGLERAYDKLWTRYALEEMTQHPWRTAGLKLRNVLYFFSPRLVPYHVPTATTTIQLGEDGTFTVENSPPRRAVDRIVYAISYTPVLALAVAGVWLRRRDLRRDAILWCIVMTFVVAHAMYFPTTRYRVPIEFVLLFYAAVAIDRRL
jgi:4-amino-4-deoxy-L-arabinose transferase-like glycosyltransferase